MHGVRFNNQQLRLSWHKPPVPLTSCDLEEAEPEEEEVRSSLIVHFPCLSQRSTERSCFLVVDGELTLLFDLA